MQRHRTENSAGGAWSVIRPTVAGWLTVLALWAGTATLASCAAAAGEEPPVGWSAALVPAFFSTPETGFGGGAGLLLTHRRPDRTLGLPPQAIPFFAMYTAKSQISLALGPELYLGSGTWIVRLDLTYVDFPSHFYGVGHDAPRDAREEYTLEEVTFAPLLLRRVWGRLRSGLTYDFQKATVRDVEPDGILAHGTLTGHAGGTVSGLGPVLEWDDRDNVFFPTRGSWLRGLARFHNGWVGSDFAFESYLVDLRYYAPLAAHSVLAVQLYGQAQQGAVPFEELARLGAQLRGIFDERYIDNTVLTLQTELRFPLYGRFAAALFGGTGTVAPQLADYRLADLRWAGGLGLRFALNPAERIHVRFDVAIGDEETQVYFQFLEAF